MIHLYTSGQMHAVDQHLIEDLGTPGIELMENAAQGVATEALKLLPSQEKECLVLIGPGNNGGDGLAVLRILSEQGIPSVGMLLGDPAKFHGDARTEYERALGWGCRFTEKNAARERIAAGGILVIDALFGTGLSRDLNEETLELVQAVNDSSCFVISVDEPSGLDSDTGGIKGGCIRADRTVTFQEYKVGQFTDNGRLYCGELILHRIHDAVTVEKTFFHLTEEADIRRYLPKRELNSHKGSNGRGLLMAGSSRYPGAAKLAAISALRAGTGLLTVCIPGEMRPIFYDCPEIMTVPAGQGGSWESAACDAVRELFGRMTALAAGPGMGKIGDPQLLRSILLTGKPCVLDADALNCISENPDIKNSLHDKCILTPHAAEAARLFGTSVAEVLKDMPGFAREMASALHAIVLLKGATTCISDGENVYLNTSGNPGLAKGGSGDTLTGILLALLCQGLSPLDAAVSGAYLLGAAADKAMSILNERMLIAKDVTDAFQYVL